MRILTIVLLTYSLLFSNPSFGSAPKPPNSTFQALGISLLALPFGKCIGTAKGFGKVPYMLFTTSAGVFFLKEIKSNDDYKNTSEELRTEKWEEIEEAETQIVVFKLAAEQEFAAEESARRKGKNSNLLKNLLKATAVSFGANLAAQCARQAAECGIGYARMCCEMST